MKSKGITGKILAVAVALLLWQAAAMLLSQEFLLASPVSVIKTLFSLLSGGEVYRTVWYSFCRIAGGFLLGLAVGTALAFLAGRFAWVETALWPYMITVKSVPVASFIVIALIWLSSSGLSVFISFLIVLPVIYNNLLSGMKQSDEKLSQMAEIFSVPYRRRLTYITLPQLRPFLFSACHTAIGLAFKSGIAAEIIGIPAGSLGEKLYNAKIYLATAELFAWTVLIVVMSVVFEKLFLWLLSKIFRGLEKL